MRAFKFLALAVVAIGLAFSPSSQAQAQITFSIGGPAPVCPYGYYGYAPYNCAPYGYYGPQWFRGGVFFGAGPWYHGPRGFHGYIDNRYDPRYGYRGRFPHYGARPDPRYRNGRGYHGGGHGGDRWHGGDRGGHGGGRPHGGDRGGHGGGHGDRR